MAPSFRYHIEPQKCCLIRDFKILCTIPSTVILCIRAIVFDIPKCLFRACLPKAVKSRVRVGRRFAIKVGTAVEQKTETKLRIWSSRPREQYIDTEPKESLPPFARFISNYDVLILLVQELHYTDVLMLAQTCKSVRGGVLPSYDFDRRLTVFGRYTCGTFKHRCWACANQVCEVRRLFSLPAICSH
jgi:hypothetical protein